MINPIPNVIIDILKKMTAHKFEAYLVGGCVRDLFLNKNKIISDWDITTSAKPEEIQELFSKSRYENKFFTVFVYPNDDQVKEVHITTFRREEKYLDRRHPEVVVFGNSIEEDLSRRDFTINALALKLSEPSEAKKGSTIIEVGSNYFEVVDIYQGLKDLKNKIIKTVGNPDKRFNEDALRLMRAVRLATQLHFEIDGDTFSSLQKNASLSQGIAVERIRDEFCKIIDSSEPDRGIELLRKVGLLQYIIPELLEGVNCLQNKHHIYDVYTHNLYSLKFAAYFGYNFEVRLAALLHDIGKPRVKKGEYPSATFYQHEIVGAKMTKEILTRLKFPKNTVDKVTHLVRYHLFYYDIGKVTEAGVRRFIRRVGLDNVKLLIQLRMAERKGSGVPKAKPYRLRHFEYMIDKVKKDPINVSMLKVDGYDVMKVLNIGPGPKVGLILSALLEEILTDPTLNERSYLIERIKKLAELSVEELKIKMQKIKEFQDKEDLELRKKHAI